jgi:uncharacterized protein YndB with AHSA1/START domain
MSNEQTTIELTVERTISAPPDEVFDAWLNPEIPGTPWNEADKLLLNPTVDGFFYWLIRGTAHYGRFTRVERGSQIQHTWVSPNTLGLESTVTVTFRKKGGDTVMTLVHAGLPDTRQGHGHEGGWNYFMGNFEKQFAPASPKAR